MADLRALAEERNALAKELRENYPTVVARLVSLFARIAANDAALSALHGSRPSGAKGYLLGAELIARGLDDFSRDQPSITRELRLPDWAESNKLLWPPPAVPAAVLLAEMVSQIHDPRRHSADWFAAQQADIARRKAEEQQRIEQEAALTEENRREYERSLPR